MFGSFATAPVATLAGPQVFYDQTTGNLRQDRNGSGSATPWLASAPDNRPVLYASDSVVADYLCNALAQWVVGRSQPHSRYPFAMPGEKFPVKALI